MGGKTIALLYLGAVLVIGIYLLTYPIDLKSEPYQIFGIFIVFLIICGNAVRSFSDFEVIKAATSKIGGSEIKITFLPGASTDHDKVRGINRYQYYSVDFIDANGNQQRKRCKVTLTDMVWLEN